MEKRDRRVFRWVSWVMLWLVGCVLWWGSSEPMATASSNYWTVPPAPPILTNGSFECTNGYTLTQNYPGGKDVWIPDGWSVIYGMGHPRLLSSRMSRYVVCDGNGPVVSKMDGHDSWYLPSEDIATPPLPGKPFDLVLYQQVSATYGGAYSLSGWMASECGDNENGPKPCPADHYVAKMVGIDPFGGTDHLSPHIEWVENRTDRRWHGLHTSTTALTNTITIYARVLSPFQFHNNKGFVDAFSLVRAPRSALHPLPPTVITGEVEIGWFGEQSEDIAALPGGNYDLLFDVQARALPSGAWRDLVTGSLEQGAIVFNAPCQDIRYAFRVRARAEQPEGEPGLFPNHRYPGVWSQPQTVHFLAPAAPPVTPTLPITGTPTISPTLEVSPTLYLPLSARTTSREC